MEFDEFQLLIIKRQYDYSQHVRERIEAGEFEDEDLENCILSATGFAKKVRDERK